MRLTTVDLESMRDEDSGEFHAKIEVYVKDIDRVAAAMLASRIEQAAKDFVNEGDDRELA